MKLMISRRQMFAAGAALLGASAVMSRLPSSAYAAGNGAEELIKSFTGGVEPAQGRVLLDLPEIAENGNTVPMSLSVESPMSSDDYVEEVLVLADANPRPGVARFQFSPMSGEAVATTRIRLSGTQNVVAVARMSDGSFYMNSKEVKVTIGGCGG